MKRVDEFRPGDQMLAMGEWRTVDKIGSATWKRLHVRFTDGTSAIAVPSAKRHHRPAHTLYVAPPGTSPPTGHDEPLGDDWTVCGFIGGAS